MTGEPQELARVAETLRQTTHGLAMFAYVQTALVILWLIFVRAPRRGTP